MKRFISFGTLTLALCLPPAAAFAQVMPMSDVPGGKNITCETFLGLGSAAARDVLYFADGYAAGVEDQIGAGTPTTPLPGMNSGAISSQAVAPKSSNLSALATIGMDQLHAVCQASPKATVLSVVPGARPVSGSGTITGGTSTSSGGGGAAVTDTTGALSGASSGNSAAGAAGQALSAPTATTTPGTTTTNPATGIVTPQSGSTALPLGAAPAGTVPAPSAGAPMGGVGTSTTTTSPGAAGSPNGASTTGGTTTGTSGTGTALPGAAPGAGGTAGATP